MQKGLAPILIILLLAILGIGGYFVYTNYSQNKTTVTPASLITNDISLIPDSIGETANWKTYTNNKYQYSFKYPPDGNISESSQDSLSLTNSNSNTPPYYLLNLKIKITPQNLSASDFIDNELAVLRNNENSPNARALADKRQATMKNYQNGQINGVFMRGGSDGDSVTDFIEIVSSQKGSIYKFTIHDGNGSVSDFHNKLINQILSTFKFTQ